MGEPVESPLLELFYIGIIACLKTYYSFANYIHYLFLFILKLLSSIISSADLYLEQY